MKILILKPSSLGDVIHALPVLRLLKQHLPNSQIFWWLESSLVPLLAGDPDLSGVFSFQRRNWAAQFSGTFSVIRDMREQRFDWAIDLQGLARSGVVAWLANAGLIAGLDNEREGAREGARLYYDLIAPRAPRGTHAVDRYLAILPPLGVPVHKDFEWLPPHPVAAMMVREKWHPAGSRWIALQPGARWDTKRWPVEYFRELAQLLLPLAPDLKLAILGGKADTRLGQEIAAVDPDRCVDLTGQTSLPEMIEWVRLSSLLITNDTGPMHVAAALKKPVVALFGPSDPDGTGPYGQRQNVIQLDLPCVPCMKNHCNFERPLACLRDIRPQLVLGRVKTVGF